MVRCGWDMSSPANKLESSGILNYRLIDRFGKARFASIKPHSVNALCSAFNKNALYGENEMVSIPVNPLQPGLFSPSTCWCQGLADGVQLCVYVQPNAKATETMGEFNGALKVRLNAPPVDGRRIRHCAPGWLNAWVYPVTRCIWKPAITADIRKVALPQRAWMRRLCASHCLGMPHRFTDDETLVDCET